MRSARARRRRPRIRPVEGRRHGAWLATGVPMRSAVRSVRRPRYNRPDAPRRIRAAHPGARGGNAGHWQRGCVSRRRPPTCHRVRPRWPAGAAACVRAGCGAGRSCSSSPGPTARSPTGTHRISSGCSGRQRPRASISGWCSSTPPRAPAISVSICSGSRTRGRALRDPRHDLARAAGATIAPEAAVFVRENGAPRLVYRGRIDDRYQAPGRMRPAASTRDLGGRHSPGARRRRACSAPDTGSGMRHRRPALTARTAVIGAGVVFALAGRACARAPAADLAAAPTFTRDVAPILYRNCAPCHHPEGPGPFPLLTFDDARRHARQIVKVTTSRYMPPWPPEPGHSRFVGERRLSNSDIATLGAWQRAGSPEGDRKDLPSPPTFTSGWQLGAPDLVLTPPGSFTLPAEGADTFWNVVLPASVDRTRYVRAIEILPGTGRSCTMRTSSSIAAGWAERSTRRRPAWGSPGWTSKSCRTRSSPTATSCSGSRARRRCRSPPTWPGVWIPPPT